MEDEFDLDLSDLMAPDAPDATLADDATDEAGTQEPDDSPAPSAETEVDPTEALRAENAELRKHIDNILARMGQQQQPQAQQTESVIPDIYPEIEKLFDKTSAPAAVKMAQLIEQRIEAKLKGYTPKSEWDAAQPVLQQAVLTLDEQRAQNSLRQRGVTDQQITAAKKEMDNLIQSGQRFSSYDAAYKAGLAEVLMREKFATAKATKAGREVKAARASENDNSPADSPSAGVKLKVSRDEILNSPFDVLDRIAGKA